jgi:hypothetical protein
MKSVYVRRIALLLTFAGLLLLSAKAAEEAETVLVAAHESAEASVVHNSLTLTRFWNTNTKCRGGF